MSMARVLSPLFGDICALNPSRIDLDTHNLDCGIQMNGIKRDLFGSADPIETKKFFNDELEKYQAKACEKWGFDFRIESPLDCHSQFVWERVTPSENVIAPNVYTLTRNAHVKSRTTMNSPTVMDVLMDKRAERENCPGVQLVACNLNSNDELLTNNNAALLVFKVPAVLKKSKTNTREQMDIDKVNNKTHIHKTTNARTTILMANKNNITLKRQPKITEYMKERKRASPSKNHKSPTKRMRITVADNSNVRSNRVNNNNNYKHNNNHHNVKFLCKTHRD